MVCHLFQRNSLLAGDPMTCVTTAAAAGMGGVTCVPLQQGNVSTFLFFH